MNHGRCEGHAVWRLQLRVELLHLGAHARRYRLLGRNLRQPGNGRLGRPPGLSELRAGARSAHLYLIQDPQLRSDWQDIGTNRFVQTAQNPIVTNCGTNPILQPNGATWGNQCEVVAPSFTNGNLPGNEWIAQRIIGANASMYKDFRIKERFKAQIRLDYFNAVQVVQLEPVADTTMTQTNPATFMPRFLSVTTGIRPKADRRKCNFRSASGSSRRMISCICLPS